MTKPIANMPGPGGSLGMCALCGNNFMLEILTGKMVQTIEVEGFDMAMCLHDKCMKMLEQNGTDWRTLPEGPMRRAYEKNASRLHWHATHDEHTCLACAEKDNSVSSDAPPHPECTNPNGCRCTVTRRP